MALTPEDVVNKRFQPTKFREGYDQDEVDDFLDEVVAELKRLNALNDDLQTSLTACEQQVESLQGSAGGATGGHPGGPTGSLAEEPDVPEVPEGTDTEAAPAASAAAVPAQTRDDAAAAAGSGDGGPEPAAPAAQPAAVAGVGGGGEDPQQAVAGMIALAQKVHDDYVRDGEAERDRLVSEAREHATRLVQDAEEKQRQTLGALEQERGLLERKIDELRSFERDYRARLKAYLEGQLRDLESKGTVLPGGGAAPEAAGAGG